MPKKKTQRMPGGTPVTHSRSGWTGVVIRYVEGARSYRIRWDRNGYVGTVVPRYVEPDADVDPGARRTRAIAATEGA